ncbi:MAG TPA: thiamine phosphate synthase, partial [Planctomycetota bacterium]|nr:thiamine phosphate synthase [Planctomycetota bacterium]
MDSSILRLIDANANRAREGLRTAEDYLRFAVLDARWPAELKQLRAGITETLRGIYDEQDLLASRQSSADPLRPTEDRPERDGTIRAEPPQATAIRGLKRAQEALRILEEYSRSEYPQASAAFSRMRYRVYDCEQWMGCAALSTEILAKSSVYVLLSHELCSRGLIDTARAVLRGGARLLQLREKSQADEPYFKAASDLRNLCTEFGAVLICNDRVDVAMATGAAGVHVGQQDFP